LNVIYGVSDSGKSAIRKGIQAVLNRAPFYLRYGATEGKVVIEFDDCTISREYKKSKLLKCPSCKEKLTNDQVCEHCGEIIPVKPSSDIYYVDGKAFDKFGTNIPPMITEKMRMSAVVFSDAAVNINIATQFEDMFFIGTSYNGGLRNKMISGLVPDSEIVDETIKKMNSEKFDFRSKIKVMQTEYDDNISKLELIEADIEELKTINEKMEAIKKEIECLDDRYMRLNSVAMYFSANKHMESVKGFITKNDGAVEKMLKFTNSLEKKMENHDKLLNCKCSIAKLKILNVEMPEFEPNCASQLEEFVMIKTKLEMIKTDLKALKMLQAELPEFDSEEINSNMKQLEDCIVNVQHIKAITTLHNELKTKLDALLEDEKLATAAKDILINKFKVENADLICPHRNDVYSDECLEKFSK
jgi:ribosomal protein L32